jgi:iron complex outermembrane recepter protein
MTRSRTPAALLMFSMSAISTAVSAQTTQPAEPTIPVSTQALPAKPPATSTLAQATTQPQRTFNIPAQSLASALAELAKQSDLQLRLPTTLADGKTAAALIGPKTPASAVTELLIGSGLNGNVMGSVLVIEKAVEASADSATTLQTVVVTGTKRSQAQQQATQSVSVLRAEDTIGMQNGFDVFARIPNVVQLSDLFLPTVRGLDGNGVATGGGGAVSGANPRMSNYVDGVARTYGAAPDGQGSFWDMAQVEVYRGAQSTQLGQNSIAGANVQTTNDPRFKDEFAVQLGARNQRTTYNGAFMANKVLGEQLAIRVTGEGSDGKSAMDYSGNTASGLTAADRDELGRTRYGRYRVKALFLATDQLTLKLTAEQERRKNAYVPDFVSNSTRREVINSGNTSYFDSNNNIVAFNANYEINPEWVFDAVLSQQKAITKFLPPVVGNPDPSAFLNFTFRSTETAFEPKFVYKAAQGRTSAVVGAFIKTRKRDDLGLPGSSFVLTADDRADARSLFADATIQFAPAWDLLVAARLQDDRQKRYFSTFGGELAFGFDERNRVFLPKLGATFHASPNANFSLLTYKGYNASGGGVSFQSFTPYLYKKETAQTVEFVARTQWLNRKLTANVNVFRTQLKDSQASAIGPQGPEDQIYLNIAKARTQGLEFDLIYQHSKPNQLRLAIGLLDTKIIDFGSAANNSNNGNSLARSPRLTANLGGSFEVLPQLTVGGDVAWVGKRFSDYENTPEDKLAGYATTNLHAQYRSGNFTFTGYVNNLFDRFAQTGRTTIFNTAYVNDPRTVGVNVKVGF